LRTLDRLRVAERMDDDDVADLRDHQ
jgi:hypothetical protein